MPATVTPLPSRDLFAPFGGFGHGFAVMGPPKTGKSDFAGSCARLGKTLVLATKPREANSRLYLELGVKREIFHDPNWMPTLGFYEASGYVSLLKRLKELQADTEYDFVIIDTFTDVVELASAELLKVESAAAPRDSADSQGFYGSLRYRLREVTKALTALQFAAKPKHVIVTVHTQAPKEDVQLSAKQGGGTKKSSDNRARGVEYEGSVLPMIEGGYRTKFAGDFDMVLFSDIEITQELVKEGARSVLKPVVRYVLQAQPDLERHAGGVLSAAFEGKTIPNDFAAILAAVEGAR
jgi:hypothetical protein